MNTTPHRFAAIASAVTLSLGAGAIAQCTLPGPGATITPPPVDAWTTAIPLGFSFPCKGNWYHQMFVSDHSLIALDNGTAGSPPAGGAFLWNPNVGNLIGPRPMIAPYWSDHTPGSVGDLHVDNTSGTHCTVTWADHATYDDQQPPFTIQVTLFATGLVTMRLDCDVTNQGSTFGALNAIVGIGTPNSWLTSPSDLSSAGFAWSDTVYEEFVTIGSGIPNPLFDLAHTTLTFADLGPGNGWSIVRGLSPADPTTFQADPSPSVTYYGAASGQEAAARTNVFGLPAAGQTMQLGLTQARPNAFAAFVVGFTPMNHSVPGIGTLLTDPSSALLFLQFTDPLGQAALSVAIPNLPPYGQELFCQTATLDMAATIGLSDAAAVEVGADARSVAMVSYLEGAVIVAGGPSVAASGIYAIELDQGSSPGQMEGDLAPYVQAMDCFVGGSLIEDLTVEIDPANAAQTWTASTLFTTAPNTPMAFVVSYTSGGQEHGPFTVTSAATAQVGQFHTQPIVLPAHTGPMSGRSLALIMVETRLDASYAGYLDNVALPPEGVPPSQAATPADVVQHLAAAHALMSTLLAGHPGNTSFFDPTMPTHAQFLADEAFNLGEATCGLAATAGDVHNLILTGAIGRNEGWAAVIASKLLAAAGVRKGAKVFQKLLLQQCGDLLQELGAAIDAGKYRKALKILIKILNKVFSKRFIKKLVRKLGKKLAFRILRKLGARCVPGLGWAIFGGSLIWAIAEQW